MKPSLDKIRKEVEAYCDKLGKPIDPKIKDLVIGLKRCGIATKASCEGHKGRGRSYPWVSVPTNQAKTLARVVAWQNRPKLPDGQANTNIWVLRPSFDIYLVPEDTNRPLKKMQEEAIQFGLFLQNLPDEWLK